MDIEELFRAHAQDLYRYTAAISGDPDGAQDAVQDTFVRLRERPPAHEEGIRAWLFTVATNLVRDRARLAARRQILLAERDPPEDRPPGTDPHAVLERAELQRMVRVALGSLRERERTALLMRAHGFAHREIAAALDTSTQTIGTLLARSLTKLADALPPMEGSR